MNDLKKELAELRKINQSIMVYEKINVALPKKKSKYFDKLLKPMYAERSLLRFNINQKIRTQ